MKSPFSQWRGRASDVIIRDGIEEAGSRLVTTCNPDASLRGQGLNAVPIAQCVNRTLRDVLRGGRDGRYGREGDTGKDEGKAARARKGLQENLGSKAFTKNKNVKVNRVSGG